MLGQHEGMQADEHGGIQVVVLGSENSIIIRLIVYFMTLPFYVGE
jgi:hypothetical protein